MNTSKNRIFEAREVKDIVPLTLAEIKFWTMGRYLQIKPSLHVAKGTGSRNLYSREDVLLFALAKQLRADGLPTTPVQMAINQMRERLDEMDALCIARRGKDWRVYGQPSRTTLQGIDDEKKNLFIPTAGWGAEEALSLYILDWRVLRTQIEARLANEDSSAKGKRSRRKQP